MSKILTLLSSCHAFSPLNLAGMNLWLDASDSATITQTSGAVSQWDDKSNNENNATQGVGSRQPATNSRTLNGVNVIDFNGSENMDLPPVLLSIPAGANTIFVISASDSTTIEGRIFTGTTGTASSRWTLMYNQSSSGNNSLSFNSGASFAPVGFSPTGGVNSAHLITASRDGANTYIDTKSNTPTTGSGGSDVTLNDALILGGRSDNNVGLNGFIGEIIIYSRLLTSNEITQVENYLSSKWSI